MTTETEALRNLIRTAQLLQQNAIGCVTNHHGLDIELNGLPSWLRDIQASIDAALAQEPAADRKADVADYKIGGWLSAALEDPAVCAEMKADIVAWFEAHQPGLIFAAIEVTK